MTGPDEQARPDEEPRPDPARPHAQPVPPPPVPPPPVPPSPEQPRFLGRYAPLYGIIGGTVVYAVAFGLSLPLRVDTLNFFLTWAAAAALVTLVILVVGIVCVSRRGTRGFGAGLLISIAIGIIVGNGACFAAIGGG